MTLGAAVAAADARARGAATAYAQSPAEMTMRALFLAYFEWRSGVRRAYGCARQVEEKARTRRSVTGLTATAIRSVEAETQSELAALLRTQLINASHGVDGAFPVASAARELARDLKIRGAARGELLRVGIIRQSESQPQTWSISPHAPGVPGASIARGAVKDVLPGSAVFYFTSGRTGRARNVQAVSPDAAKRRASRPKIPGTIGPRVHSGPIRRIVSGGGGPGTGKR